jgi:hypothetical protein
MIRKSSSQYEKGIAPTCLAGAFLRLPACQGVKARPFLNPEPARPPDELKMATEITV